MTARPTSSRTRTTYKDALAALPKDNIAVGYVDGAQLATLTPARDLAGLLARRAGRRRVAAGAEQLSAQLKGVRSLAFAVTPEDQGLRFRVRRAAREGRAGDA